MIPVIFGCEGLKLTPSERQFFSDVQPFGYILFARNIENPLQLQALTAEFRAISGDDVPILIDQEGGRVQRMREPHWRSHPPMVFFGDLAKLDETKAFEALRLNIQMISFDLLKVGINVNCLPLLDVPIAGADQIIGDRAFSNDIDTIIAMGRAVVDTFIACGVFPVIKHIPGHGRALVDSHLSLPCVNERRNILSDTDFRPFKGLKDAPFAMTAHIVYSDIDKAAPATQSQQVVKSVIRNEIGFKGLLMTDDLSMKALKGDMKNRTLSSLEAGCDLILHCNGDMTEMTQIVSAIDGRDFICSERPKLDPEQKIELAINDIEHEYNQIVTALQ